MRDEQAVASAGAWPCDSIPLAAPPLELTVQDAAEHFLDNGLKVVTRESRTVPLISFFVWYRVGARNEPAGMSGASHWVEHMLFKRTRTLAPGDIGRLVTGVGGAWNGFTTEDTTAYFETVPAQHLDLPLRIEADRMVNAVFDPDDVSGERTVIISEREGHESSPMFLLTEAIEAAAFQAHPYGRGVIGSKADLNRMSRDELFSYYRRHYTPNNAVIVTVGDFDTSELLARIDAAFGRIPAGELPAPPGVEEPAQTEQRRVEVVHPGPFPILNVCHRTPPLAHPDFFALLALDALLSGPKGGVFGGGGVVRTSRLYQRFVASGLAAAAGSDLGFNIDPTLHRIFVALKPGSETAPIEDAVDEELARLRDAPPEPEELARAVRQARAKQAIGLEGVTSQALWLGFLETTESWRKGADFNESFEAVTPADVQRVARQYLHDGNRVTGWFNPERASAAV